MDEIYRDPELAASQKEMLGLFHACENPEDLLQRIAGSAIQDDLKTWLLSCDPAMLGTASELVRKWGSLNPERGIGAPSTPDQNANPSIPP